MRVAELNLTSKAFCNFKTITKGMFKRAYRKKWVDFRVEEEVLEVIDLSEKKFRKIRKEDYQEVFSEEEYSEYVKFLSDNPDIWNLALLLILVTGLRGGEVVTLSYEDIELRDGFFAIKVHKTETRYKDKKGKYVYAVKEEPKSDAGLREAIVPRQFNWMYDAFRKAGNCTGTGFIFTNPKTGNRCTTNSLRRRQERNCKQLNIYQKSPHKGRKTYGSILLDNKLDNNLIIQQMGHADISTTEIHYHRNMKNLEKKADLISRIPSFDIKIS
jgi:integrase